MERAPVAVIGGGQAGLAVSHELTRHDVEHVVLERGRVGQTWCDRWDSFCLVTPNWRPPRRCPPASCSSTSRAIAPEEQLPPGRVLVVGSGQSGCQIAEELHEASRDVVVACGKAPWAPRRIGGRDLCWWAVETEFMDHTVETLSVPGARLAANILLTGHGGGRDLHLRTLHEAGVTLTGHFLGAADHEARFASDLGESVAWGDERYAQFATLIRNLVRERGLDEPAIDEHAPFDVRAPERLDRREFGSVLFTTGFRPDYRSWLPWPDAFDELGFPIHRAGESTVVPGLHFVGVHFLRKRKSSLLLGVGEDAAIVADRIADAFA